MYRQILQVQPNQPDAVHLLGVIALQTGHYDAAVEQIQKAIKLSPKTPTFHNNLGAAYQRLNKLPEALACHQQALRLQSDLVDAHYNVGVVLEKMGRSPDSAKAYQETIRLNPRHVEALNNLGNVYRALGKLDDAITAYQQALQLKPVYPNAYNNMGNVLKDQGLLDQAIDAFHKALEQQPDYIAAHCNLVYALNFSPRHSPEAIYQEHVRWNERHAQRFGQQIDPHTNDRTPDRRLKIGYVSPDLSNHSVGRFMTPILANHDHQNFEIHCYSSVARPDHATQRFQSQSDVWRDVRGLDDANLARLIRQDQIDVLIDLTMHMAQNRLLVFARKPAPVQATYLAYCGTTGLTTMDYRLTDPHLDPTDTDDRYYSEKSVRLPESYWCYPPVDAPAVKPVPALQAGHITFGCLNNFCKITEETLATWAELLHAVSNSRLILHGKEGAHRERVKQFFTAQGITADRLTFIEFLGINKYLEVYHQIDVGLDPFPYGGGTTTCDALWMGVPVVTLSGNTAVGRGGRSILTNAGLPELIAHNTTDYSRITRDLAADLPRLTQIRSTLREKMQTSPLMDAPRFTRNLEAAYRTMWKTWCNS